MIKGGSAQFGADIFLGLTEAGAFRAGLALA